MGYIITQKNVSAIDAIRIMRNMETTHKVTLIPLDREPYIPLSTLRFYAPTIKALEQYKEQYRKEAFNFRFSTCHNSDIAVQEIDTKGWVFYAEYENAIMKHKDVAHSPNRHVKPLQYTTGNVIAVYLYQEDSRGMPTCISAIYSNPQENTSALTWGECSYSYLRECGKRISLEQALVLHPNMFLSGYFDKED